MQRGLFDGLSGDDRKTSGIDLVLANETPEWKDLALELLVALMRDQPEFTSEDLRVRARAGALEDPHHPNCWGAVFTRAAKIGLIERCGFRPSRIASAHARQIGVWRIAHGE